MTVTPPGFVTLRQDFEKLGSEKFAGKWTGAEVDSSAVDDAAHDRWIKTLESYANDLKQQRRVIFTMESNGDLLEVPGKLWWAWDPKEGVDANERLAEFLKDAHARHFVKASETPAAVPSTDGAYLSPFIQMMLEAVRRFGITAINHEKKEILEAHFRNQKLPDGKPITKAQAQYLATFCRSHDAMKGGNKRMG
ncbi:MULTISPECIES: hypothetical protein [Mesorhizobium]|uniref:Uncharacterized protein n=1 Tax=Mesorhizobium denitrificans TaxID=2294114 RepID=A0A371XG07_9HYPH|nr:MULTISPECIES: hypothetical protein [Mesorhizobium]RFC68151.1 hypothetical protein DY251_07705 [Mesorhizobium denitrificans]